MIKFEDWWRVYSSDNNGDYSLGDKTQKQIAKDAWDAYKKSIFRMSNVEKLLTFLEKKKIIKRIKP